MRNLILISCKIRITLQFKLIAKSPRPEQNNLTCNQFREQRLKSWYNSDNFNLSQPSDILRTWAKIISFFANIFEGISRIKNFQREDNFDDDIDYHFLHFLSFQAFNILDFLSSLP